MSRPNPNENLNAVQMFPFVAVLLCTMGSLLVLLVAVARSSRVQAVEQATADQAARAAAVAAAKPLDEALRRKYEDVKRYAAELGGARTRADRQLREDQLRLSHIEDHMRRMREQLESLQLAAAELNTEEGHHYDDREQAERELARLLQLIAESQHGIADLRSETSGRGKSVAILPTVGPKGTRRQPIYLECTEQGVFIQPEGIQFTQQDFMGPPGPSSPLAAALRAAREHIVMQNPGIAAGEEAEPYALLVMRPGGQAYFQAACEVIHQAGLDFGYELIDADWDLKYPTPDPKLASVEFQAIDMARQRMRLLASAAPRMYDRGAWAGDDGGYGEPSGNDGGETAGQTGGQGGGFVRHGGGGGGGGVGGGGYVIVAGGPRGRGGRLGDGGENPESKSDGPKPEGTEKAGGASSAETNKAQEQDSAAGSPAIAPPGKAKPPAKVRFGTAPKPSDVAADGEQPAEEETSNEYLTGQMQSHRGPRTRPKPVDEDDEAEKLPQPRGKDWAIKKMPGTVPIRRTIQVVVRQDRLAILPNPSAESAGREVVLHGSTGASLGKFVTQLQNHMDEWGIAGQGLAWRPVLELKVGPDGNRRAEELARLLQDSGIEVRTTVAQHETGEPPRANR